MNARPVYDVFHNTTPIEDTALLRRAIEQAQNQDAAVLAIFRRTGLALTPSEVWKYGTAADQKWLLTSVRRSISNLTKQGLLIETCQTRVGPYGRPEREWRLKVSTDFSAPPKEPF
jgi:hypothetical protein